MSGDQSGEFECWAWDLKDKSLLIDHFMARSLVNPADFWICGQNSMVGNRSSWYEVVSIRPHALKLYKKISITPIIVCASWTKKTFGVTIHRSVSQLVTPRLIKLVSKRAVNPWCHRWNETPVGELLHSTIYFLGFYKKKSDFFLVNFLFGHCYGWKCKVQLVNLCKSTSNQGWRKLEELLIVIY